MEVILCDYMMIDPSLPVDLTYDRIATSNQSDYISFPALLTKFKGYLNASNSHSVLMTEMHNWVDDFLPEVKGDIFLRAPELTPKVVKDTNNPLHVATGHLTSLIEYHNIIPDFQLYLRADLIESHTETELESFRRQRKKLPSIKTIIADLGLELRDYVRNENIVFPFKWAVNCRRDNLNRGHEFTLEWTLPTSSQ